MLVPDLIGLKLKKPGGFWRNGLSVGQIEEWPCGKKSVLLLAKCQNRQEASVGQAINFQVVQAIQIYRLSLRFALPDARFQLL